MMFNLTEWVMAPFSQILHFYCVPEAAVKLLQLHLQ